MNNIEYKNNKNKCNEDHFLHSIYFKYANKMQFVPEYLYHDAPNPFTLYGFHYKSIAHYLVIQTHARRALPFKHFFDMEIEDLPPVHCVNKTVLEEGLNAMLPDIEPKKFKYPISHHLLGIGATRYRLKFGAPETGKNVYGKSMRMVLKRRRALK